MMVDIALCNEFEKYLLIKGLLQACQVFHQNGYCHGDISIRNVLLMEDKKPGYLALTDYGHAKEIGAPESQARGCYEYESPEISAWMYQFNYTDKKNYAYYHEQPNPSFAKQIFHNQPHLIESHSMHTVYPAEDCWAMGVVLFKILYNNASPTLADLPKIQANPLLNGLLSIKRSERIDISTALQRCDDKMLQLKALATPSQMFTLLYNEHQKKAGESSESPSNAQNKGANRLPTTFFN